MPNVPARTPINVALPPPSVNAAIGAACRLAWPMDGEMRSLEPFDALLRRLGRTEPDWLCGRGRGRRPGGS